MNDTPTDHVIVRGLSGGVAGRSWKVTAARALVLGRAVAASEGIIPVTVPEPRISAYHFRLEWADGAFRVRDLDSTNGVRVNGLRLPRGASEPLRHGDVVTAADLTLEVRLSAHAAGLDLEASLADTSLGSLTEAVSTTGASLVPELMPHPFAMAVRRVGHAIDARERVQEIIRGFEVVLQFQTLTELSCYLAAAPRVEAVDALLDAFLERPFSLGRWLELHNALTGALAGSSPPVLREITGFAGDEERTREFRLAASRLVEHRNRLLHGDAMTGAAASAAEREMLAHFGRLLGSLAFWIGFRVLAVEGGAWSDRERAFDYPCRLLLGSATPFETTELLSPEPLPPRTPILVDRPGIRRLSLAPFQVLRPGDDRQLHWFRLTSAAHGRMTLSTYPATFQKSDVDDPDLALLLRERPVSGASADFSGTLVKRGA